MDRATPRTGVSAVTVIAGLGSAVLGVLGVLMVVVGIHVFSKHDDLFLFLPAVIGSGLVALGAVLLAAAARLVFWLLGWRSGRARGTAFWRLRRGEAFVSPATYSSLPTLSDPTGRTRPMLPDVDVRLTVVEMLLLVVGVGFVLAAVWVWFHDGHVFIHTMAKALCLLGLLPMVFVERSMKRRRQRRQLVLVRQLQEWQNPEPATDAPEAPSGGYFG